MNSPFPLELSDDVIEAGVAGYEEWERDTGRDGDPAWISPSYPQRLVEFILRSIVRSQPEIHAFAPVPQDPPQAQ